MKRKNILVGLDVGTTKICTLVARFSQNNKFEIIGIGNHPSHGLKKGCVINIEKTIDSIRKSINEAKIMAGVDFDNATVGISGNHIASFNSQGEVEIRGEEVTHSDVERAIGSAKGVPLPEGREILHVIPQDFKIDDIDGIKDPLGICGNKIEAKIHIVTGQVHLIQNLVKCVEAAGVYAEQITLQPIASSEATLSAEEKDSGVVLIDIGGGTTDIAIWKDGSLSHTEIIPVGGNLFTNDLSEILKISFLEAEKLKISYGNLLKEGTNSKQKILLKVPQGERSIEVRMINEILISRAKELFRLINRVVDDSGLYNKMAAGFVLTGGGSQIPGLETIGSVFLDGPARIGYPLILNGMTKSMQNPKYSTVLGLLIEANKRRERIIEKSIIMGSGNNFIGKLKDSLRLVLKEIF
jgi:cell division protein FtsA